MTNWNHLHSQAKDQNSNIGRESTSLLQEKTTQGMNANGINRRKSKRKNLKLKDSNDISNSAHRQIVKAKSDDLQPDKRLQSVSRKRETSGFENLSVLDRSVARSGLSYDSFVRALLSSALSRLVIWDQTDLDRLLLTAEKLNLDPLCGEIYAVDASSDAEIRQNQNKSSGKKAIVIVVSVDGWSRLINSHPQFDGMRLLESEPGHDELPLYFECTIFRKDRKVATSIREYMYEAHTGQGAWLTHPRRMLRHKAMVQCARICFGLGGIYEPDEAQKVVQALSVSKTKNNSYEFGLTPDLQNKNEVAGQDYATAEGNFTISKSVKLGTGFVKDWVKNQTR